MQADYAWFEPNGEGQKKLMAANMPISKVEELEMRFLEILYLVCALRTYVRLFAFVYLHTFIEHIVDYLL